MNREKSLKEIVLTGVMLIILLAGFQLRVHNIDCAMPYIGNVDEKPLAIHAGRILLSGKFNPHFFHYPSLPIYLTTFCFTAGFFNAASHCEINNTKDIGCLSYPYYEHARVVYPAKIMFAFLSILAILFAAFISRSLSGNSLILILTPLTILLSDIYFFYSQKYLNVDIVGNFFIFAALLFILQHTARDDFLFKSIYPGILCGFALGCKYNLGWIIVPAVLAVFFYSNGKKISKITVLFLCMFSAFLFVTPYAVWNFKEFLNDVANEIFHYQTGHVGFSGKPGMEQFLYYIHQLVKDYGLISALFCLAGIGFSFRKDWKKTVLLLSFAFPFLAFMSFQKVHFVRNILSLFVLYGLFTALGFYLLSILLKRLLQSRMPSKSRRYATGLANTSAILALLIVLPAARPVTWMKTQPDTRKQAVAWVLKSIKKGSEIIVPRELHLDFRKLARKYEIAELKFKKMDPAEWHKRINKDKTVYVFLPHFAEDKRLKSNPKRIAFLQSLKNDVIVLKTFDGNDVLTNYITAVPNGNPGFDFCSNRQIQTGK